MLLSADYSRDLYHRELQYLIDYGDPVEVRGRQTLEILNFVSEVRQPWHHCILLPSRRWNPWIALSETLWILAGSNDVESLKPYNRRIETFSDDGVTLYGAYGHRIYDQIDDVILRLHKDPGDRRAILTIWDLNDLMANTKDPPCNNLVYFKLRQNQLHMTVINRSNDIHWGLFAVNLPTFGILQSYIAARLGAEMGTQTHLSNSLHVYTDQPEVQEITERMLITEPEDRPAYPQHGLAFTPDEFQNGVNHIRFAENAVETLAGVKHEYKYELFNFASRFLPCYTNKEFNPDLYKEFPRFSDWVLAAEIFSKKVWNK